jgi:hypothetical protein
MSGSNLMTVNNCAVGLNMPAAIKDTGDHLHALPPRRVRKAFLVDEYPACPEHWFRSNGRIKSYFVPVVENQGMWLDFNECLSLSEYDVAIVVSVQGVNAITGLPCKDPQLEQYRDECPKHKAAFGPDRFCKECNFKWPKQNYVASAATPNGFLWLDGFRSVEGVIRQYVFTASVLRSVAKAVVGGDRVFALGISFFLSKQKRPKPPTLNARSAGGSVYLIGYDGAEGTNGWANMVSLAAYSGAVEFFERPPGSTNSSDDEHWVKGRSLMDKSSLMRSTSMLAKKMSLMSMVEEPPVTADSAPVKKLASTKAMEIAAGAKIDQRIHDDANGLDFYQDTPEGIIVVNYCLEAEADAIIKAGKVDVSGSKEGFLQNIPIGNP